MEEITSNAFLIDADISWQDLGGGVKRKILGYDQSVMLVKVQFQTGAVGSLHQHPHVQSTYVESGVFKATIDGEERILQQGDGFFVAPNLIHGCVCLEAGVLIDTFSPCRIDFL